MWAVVFVELRSRRACPAVCHQVKVEGGAVYSGAASVETVPTSRPDRIPVATNVAADLILEQDQRALTDLLSDSLGAR